MLCPFCRQSLDPKSAWKGTADFYCSEFCADSETVIPSNRHSPKERFDRQYLARLERLVALRRQQAVAASFSAARPTSHSSTAFRSSGAVLRPRRAMS
jgi:hypothetical protein